MKMKKLKRVFAVTLAAMMTVGMLATSAYADGETTTDTDGIKDRHVHSVTVSKTVEVSRNGTLLPDEKFKITMVPATSDQLVDADGNAVTNSEGVKIQAGHELENDTIEFEFNASDSTATGSVTKSDTFNFEFEDPYTSTGVYRYYVTETCPLTDEDGNPLTDEDGNRVYSNGYITYDQTQYIVDLYILQDSATDQFMVSTYVLQDSKAAKPQNISFTNKITCSDLKIFKKVVGTEYSKGELYTFRLLIPVGGTTITLKEGQTFTAYLKDANGIVVDTENNRTDADGKIAIKVGGDDLEADMTEGTTFQMKAGEYLDIVGAPATMVYKVEEVVEDATVNASKLSLVEEGYTTTYDYKEYGKNKSETRPEDNEIIGKSGNSVTGTINTESNEVTFTNTRQVSVGTGINLTMLPYALITLCAICGGILFISRKRRVDR
jgi:hypothetical protein